MVTPSIEVLLSAYIALKQEKEWVIATHLQSMQQQAVELLPVLLQQDGGNTPPVFKFDRLYEQVTMEENPQRLMEQLQPIEQSLRQQAQTMQGQELAFAHAQAALFDQLRPYLAADARSLLLISHFQAFAKSLSKQARLKLVPAPTKWLLPSLGFPLQIQSLEASAQVDAEKAASTIFAMRFNVCLGQWQQLIILPTAIVQYTPAMRHRAVEPIAQWQEANCQLQPTLQHLPTERSRQGKLAQELAVVFAYVAATFDYGRVTDRLDYLQP